jgi:hypothetical protein
VSVLPVQTEVPQALPLGYTQAPLATSQLVALQAGSAVAPQAAVQQFPVPAIPQTPDVQASLVVQGPVAEGARHWWLVVSQ